LKTFKRLSLMVMSVILLLGLLAACSKSSNQESGNAANNAGASSNEQSSGSTQQGETVKITFFNTSAEVNTVFEELFAKYHEINPNVIVELIPTPIGGAQIEKFQAMLASGTPPTIANLDAGHIYQYQDKFLDLESEKAKYESLTQPGAVDGGVFDGKFLGIPWTAQGYGLLYNQRVVEEALGGPFDPSTIRTRDDLENLFAKIEAAGVPPVMIHGADWSLGSHYLGLAYALQSRDMAENLKFYEELKAGQVNLAENPVFVGVMDTFDVLKKYNARKKDPLVADYAKDSGDFAKGESAFYFMGDWTWAVIGSLEGRDEQFGIIPVPMSNNPDDYGNGQVAYSEPKLFAIDNSGSTPEQQEAAKAFLEWMLTSEEGQKAIVEEMGLFMPYKDVKAQSTNVISNAIAKYVNEGQTINISITNYFPADFWSKTGASMQKYLVDHIDRAQFYKEVEDYWKQVK